MVDIKIETSILSILRKGEFTAIELDLVLHEYDERCPDDLARTLSQMRKKGLIHGKFSEEKSAWVFWADKE